MKRKLRPSTSRAGSVRILLASAALWACTLPADAGTIADTVRATLKTNPEIGVVKNDRRAVEQELRQARAGYLPSIDLRAAAGPEISNSPVTRRRGPGSTNSAEQFRTEGTVRLSQMLFDGFETRSEVARQTARVDSASYRVREAAEFIGVDAIEAHLEVMRNQETVRLNETNVVAHERILRQARSLERGGRADIADVRQSEARLATAQASLAQARGALADSIALYLRIVGEQPGTLSLEPVPVRALPVGVEAAASLASVQSPTVLIAASDVDVAAAELLASRSDYYPRVDLELAGTAAKNVTGSEGADSSASALVVMRYNLYRGGADVAREREAFHRLNEARSRLLQTRRDAEEDARVSFNAYETAIKRVLALRTRSDAQRRTRDAYASQYDLGQRDLLDVLDSENELFLARVQLLTAEYTERFAVYRILGVIGSLLETLQVARPKEEINIYRSPERVHTSETVESKSKQLVDRKAEPRPLRGEAAGEAPLAVPDVADAINTPSMAPPAPGSAIAPPTPRPIGAQATPPARRQ